MSALIRGIGVPFREEQEAGQFCNKRRIQLPTSNIQHSTSNGSQHNRQVIGCWMLDVECWMLKTNRMQPNHFRRTFSRSMLDVERLSSTITEIHTAIT